MTESTDQVRDYHARTFHRLDGYAKGPATLDWDAQPDPFRRFDGAPQTSLPLLPEGEPSVRYADLFRIGATPPLPMNLSNLAALFELSLGISAWKSYMGDRWALRCNPSSGNLHPTEGYALCAGIPDIAEGVYHYRPAEHALEQRSAVDFSSAQPRLAVGLSSVLWREGWKYGERAFRYCQLDIGHAVGAFSYAAAALGWQVRLLGHHGEADIARLFGLADTASFAGAEPELPELLLTVSPRGDAWDIPREWFDACDIAEWQGKANRLDPRPYGAWPVIDEVAAATAAPAGKPRGRAVNEGMPAMQPPGGDHRAAELIRQRRSAQHFDPRPLMPLDDFLRLLDAVLPRPGTPPWPENMPPTRIHPVLFVHRVEGLRQGLYALPRSAEGLTLMRESMRADFAWQELQITSRTDIPPLHLLINADCRNAARTLSCHQDIASNSAFAVAMLGEFDRALSEGAAQYRSLFHEAGLVGQAFYLEAENAGVRGTGIGCYFDPAVHEVLGIGNTTLQSMYHFTVGAPMADTRIETLPAYAHLKRRNSPK